MIKLPGKVTWVAPRYCRIEGILVLFFGAVLFFITFKLYRPDDVPSWDHAQQILRGAGPWTFNADTDGHSYSLTEKQCDSAFPGLFAEIHASVLKRRDNHISEDELNRNDVSDSNTRAMIWEGDVGNPFRPCDSLWLIPITALYYQRSSQSGRAFSCRPT